MKGADRYVFQKHKDAVLLHRVKTSFINIQVAVRYSFNMGEPRKS